MNIASSNLLIDFVKMGYGIGYVTDLYVKNELQKNNLTIVDISPTPPKYKNKSYTTITPRVIPNFKNKFFKCKYKESFSLKIRTLSNFLVIFKAI